MYAVFCFRRHSLVLSRVYILFSELAFNTLLPENELPKPLEKARKICVSGFLDSYRLPIVQYESKRTQWLPDVKVIWLSDLTNGSGLKHIEETTLVTIISSWFLLALTKVELFSYTRHKLNKYFSNPSNTQNKHVKRCQLYNHLYELVIK